MEADKIKILMDKYYSGDILPEEYQCLISVLKDADKLTPELEAERNMFLAIESYEPSEPEGFETKLIKVINHREKRNHFFLRMAYSCSAAAIAVVLITIGLHTHFNRSNEIIAPTANISAIHEVALLNESIETKGILDTTRVTFIDPGNRPLQTIANEDLANSFQIADEALMDVLASIQVAQNEVVEVIDNIDISQATDNNT